MKIKKRINQKYSGADNRTSLLDVIFSENVSSPPIVFFAHGFKGFKDWGPFPIMADELAKQGFIVIIFNFSHNGGTMSNPIDFPDLEAFSENTISKELYDLDAVYRWVKNDNELSKYANLNEIYLIGHSRGGGVSLLAAKEFNWLKKVVTWAGVSDFYDRLPAKEQLKKWKENGIRTIKNSRTNQNMPMKYSYVEDLEYNRTVLNIETAVQQICIPQLIIHGEQDETVKETEAYQLKRWNQGAELIILENANHTLGGKHPFNSKKLPSAMKTAVEYTVKFFRN